MSDHQKPDGRPRYYEVDTAIGEALRFANWSEAIAGAVHELIAGMPVRPFRAETAGGDSWDAALLVGDAPAVTARLGLLLVQDRSDAVGELGESVDYEVVVTTSNLQPDALHVVARLSPRGSPGGAVMYGARVQRVSDHRFALWSDF